MAATSITSLKEELADVQEVINVLCAHNGINPSEIEKIRIAKKNAKGGFSSGIFISCIEVDNEHPNIEQYRTKFGKKN